ncbi:unnamed protein product [Echinostoma caproni]|uniref:Protein kinase domain-containing protein n=1 Tax=Echinostoma caproni TaxID=27848 RepID=A0A183BEM7_9TREM|nr:unnamed protein product [Echinostoma caproni]
MEHHLGNLAYRNYLSEQTKANNLARSSQHHTTSPTGGTVNSIEHSNSTSPISNSAHNYNGTRINGTADESDKPITMLNGNGDLKLPQKKVKNGPLSIPTSPPTGKYTAPEPQLTSRVGKYTIVRTVGRGNFAQVKLAIHVTTGREVSVRT